VYPEISHIEISPFIETPDISNIYFTSLIPSPTVSRQPIVFADYGFENELIGWISPAIYSPSNDLFFGVTNGGEVAIESFSLNDDFGVTTRPLISLEAFDQQFNGCLLENGTDIVIFNQVQADPQQPWSIRILDVATGIIEQQGSWVNAVNTIVCYPAEMLVADKVFVYGLAVVGLMAQLGYYSYEFDGNQLSCCAANFLFSGTILGFYATSEYFVIVYSNAQTVKIRTTKIESCVLGSYDCSSISSSVDNFDTLISDSTCPTPLSAYDAEHEQLYITCLTADTTTKLRQYIYDIDGGSIHVYSEVEPLELAAADIISDGLYYPVIGPCYYKTEYLDHAEDSWTCLSCGCTTETISYNLRLAQECTDVPIEGDGKQCYCEEGYFGSTCDLACNIGACNEVTTLGCDSVDGSCVCNYPYLSNCYNYDASVEYANTTETLELVGKAIGASGMFNNVPGEDYTVYSPDLAVFVFFVKSSNTTKRAFSPSYAIPASCQIVSAQMIPATSQDIDSYLLLCTSVLDTPVLDLADTSLLDTQYTFAGWPVTVIPKAFGNPLPAFYEIPFMILANTPESWDFSDSLGADVFSHVFLYLHVEVLGGANLSQAAAVVEFYSQTLPVTESSTVFTIFNTISLGGVRTITIRASETLAGSVIFGVYDADPNFILDGITTTSITTMDTTQPTTTTINPTTTTTTTTTTTVTGTTTTTTTHTPPTFEVSNTTELAVTVRVPGTSGSNGEPVRVITGDFLTFENITWPDDWQLTTEFQVYNNRPVPTRVYRSRVTLGLNSNGTENAEMRFTTYAVGDNTLKFSLQINSIDDSAFVFSDDSIAWRLFLRLELPVVHYKKEVSNYDNTITHKIYFTSSFVILIIVDPTVLIDGEVREVGQLLEFEDNSATLDFYFPIFNHSMFYDPTVGAYRLVDTHSTHTSPFSGGSDKHTLLYLLSLISIIGAIIIVAAITLFIVWREKLKDGTWEKHIQNVNRVRNITIGAYEPNLKYARKFSNKIS